MAKPWLRLYREAIHRPKVGRMKLEEIGFWSACLMMSNDEGLLPDIGDIAWTLRLDDWLVTTHLEALERNGLVTRYVTGNVTKWHLHDFAEHQRKSDHDESGAERQRKFREAKKAQESAISALVTNSNALRNGPVTLPDTDTDTEEEKKKEVEGRVTAPPKSRGTTWPPDAVVPELWIEEGEAVLSLAGREKDLRIEAIKFQNHWASKTGSDATKKDWKRTWLNWCLSEYGDRKNGKSNGQHGKTSAAAEVFGSLYATARAQRESAGD